jgi:predicted RNase H-like HicB family nuclease
MTDAEVKLFTYGKQTFPLLVQRGDTGLFGASSPHIPGFMAVALSMKALEGNIESALGAYVQVINQIK